MKTTIKRLHKTSQPGQFKRIGLIIISLLIVAIFTFIYVFKSVPVVGDQSASIIRQEKMAQHGFRIDGSLSFFDETGKLITTISIEIAEDDYSHERGLMYRHYIPDKTGMLFIYPEEDYRSFWMKNTPSSLDIIYCDAEGKIVRIYENTEPYSQESMPSGDPAMYVVEVKGGFCSEYGITAGNRITFERTE